MAALPDSKRYPRFQDITGKRFGKLVAIEFEGRVNRSSRWRCICDCGNEKVSTQRHLVSGNTKSCGCNVNPRHAQAISSSSSVNYTYQTWFGMKNRCCNKNSNGYSLYGAKGISVCSRWLSGEQGKTGFDCFIEDMGLRPVGKTLDRRDDARGYSKDNCRWATALQQSWNKKSTILAKIGRETKSLSGWSRDTGIDIATLRQRWHKGWRGKKLISPPRKKKAVTSTERG